MNKLLIAAFALGALGFAQTAVSAPATSPMLSIRQADDGLIQKACERRGFWGRDNRSWRDDLRRGHTRDWDDKDRQRDKD